MHPVYLIFPVALAVNFSFILPVSTPGNAIVYAYGDITVPDMVCVHIFSAFFLNTFLCHSLCVVATSYGVLHNKPDVQIYSRMKVIDRDGKYVLLLIMRKNSILLISDVVVVVCPLFVFHVKI